MSEATDYLENKLVDHICGTTTYTKPTAIYIQLHTGTVPTSDIDGTLAIATNAIRKVTGTMAASASGVSTNAADISWSTGDVSGTETYTHYTIWDADTTPPAVSGNCLMWSAFDAPVSVTSGDQFTIAAGNLSVSVA